MKTNSGADRQISNDCDKNIVQLILSGETQQFSNIHKKYYSLIFSIVKKITKETDDDADDIVQNIFIKIYTSLKLYNPEYLFFSWIYKLTTNHCLDYIKRRKTTKSMSFNLHNFANWNDTEFDTVADSSYSPDNKLIKDETIQEMHKAIETLPDKYKQVVLLRYFAELNYENIAKYLGVPIGTVKTTLHRGKKMLEEELKKQAENISNLLQ